MATLNKHYTVLTYNINGYEIVHPIKEKSERARYIMVTDDPNLKDESGSWEIIVDDTLSGSTFDKCYQVRFDPFKYTDDFIVLRVDGSVGIEKNLDPLIDKFIEGGYDRSLMHHPTRQTQYEEYTAWCQGRQFPMEDANYVLSFMHNAEGFNVQEFKGMAQMCYEIETNTRINNDLNRMTYSFLKYLGNKGDGIHRVDQTIFSFVAQKYFPGMKIMWVDQRMYNGESANAPFQWYPHHSDKPFPPMDVKMMKDPYWLNKKCHNAIRPQDL